MRELHDAHVRRWHQLRILELWVREYGISGARRLWAATFGR